MKLVRINGELQVLGTNARMKLCLQREKKNSLDISAYMRILRLCRNTLMPSK